MARVSIEDCLEVMPNRFALVVVAANRARQLMGSSAPMLRTKNKAAVTALREIAEGLVEMKGAIELRAEALENKANREANLLDEFTSGA